jgi:hypothetical protein
MLRVIHTIPFTKKLEGSLVNELEKPRSKVYDTLLVCGIQ